MAEDSVLTVAETRAYDAAAIARGISGMVLMEHAAAAAAEVLLELGATGPIGILCGKGNNGGDGLVMTRRLRERGIAGTLILAEPPDRFRGDAAEAWRRLGNSQASVFDDDAATLIDRLQCCEWLVDALLGTGFTGIPRSPYDVLIRTLNAAGRPILAVDVPSGLDADLGTAPGEAVRATATVTFVGMKIGFLQPAAAAFTGQVFVRPILGGLQICG